MEFVMRRVFVIPILLATLFYGCESGLLPDLDFPEDRINDVLRKGTFQYEVVVPVRLSITVNSFSGAPQEAVVSGDTGLAGRAIGTDTLFVVQLTDNMNRPIFTGSVPDGGTLTDEVLVPATLKRATLTIDSPLHERRHVVIEQPALYEEVNREMAAVIGPIGDKTADRDHDGIDDYYDAFPDDPALAFTRSIPASNDLRIAFEDNFPELGDGDYNDFVADYRIVEYRSAKNVLVSVEGIARAVARGAGYDHEFGLVIDCEGLTGEVNVLRYDGSGNSIGSEYFSASDSVRVILFESSKAAFDRETSVVTMDNVYPDAPVSAGHTTVFTVVFSDQSDASPNEMLTPYNPYLLIENPSLEYRPDVHLIGDEPLADSENPLGFKDFRDADGYPRALLVPDDWMPPAERTNIEVAYPYFTPWRESLGATNTDWYFYPIGSEVVSIP